MKVKMYLSAILAISMLFGCNRDEIENDPNNGGKVVNPSDNVYMSVSVQLPDGGPSTRSSTIDPDDDYSASSDGTESGKVYENNVSKMLIVLAKSEDNSFIAACTVDNVSDMLQQTTVQATVKLSKTTLANYYGSDNTLDAGKGENKINVFVVCNYTDELKNYFKFDGNGVAQISLGDKGWINEVCEVTEDNDGNSYKNVTVWKQNSMLMTSASIAPKKLPIKLDEWNAFSSSTTPFNLSSINYTPNGEGIDNNGSIRVERSVARFDFKDGSELGGNRYHAVYVRNADGTITNYVDIELNRMALVNMSNKFYYFRRVANKDGGNVQVGFPELLWQQGKTGNYVVDYNYDTKTTGREYFNFPLFDNEGEINETAREQWYTSKISDVLGSENDEYDDKSYHIWRYVTENTVNSTARMTNGLSTGVVFKGRMVPTDYVKSSQDTNIKRLAYVLNYNENEKFGLTDDDIKDIKLTKNTNTDPILYAYSGMLYLRWPSVRNAAIADSKIGDLEEYDKSRSFYLAVFGSGSHDDNGGEYSDDVASPDYLWHKWQESKSYDDLKAFKKAATANGFTLYQSSNDDEKGWGYYCYYFYWNQHNNNNNPNVMGEMEFAVVRNNVYKLAVTKINQLGHPRLSENDPSPVDPDDPDEKGDVYIEVSVSVLPWVVRKNNIEF